MTPNLTLAPTNETPLTGDFNTETKFLSITQDRKILCEIFSAKNQFSSKFKLGYKDNVNIYFLYG